MSVVPARGYMRTPEEYGAEGGKARAAKLTKEERQAIGRAGAIAKWAKAGKAIQDVPIALYGTPERPLKIGEIEIPCYVLSDGRRVLTQRGLLGGMGLSTSGGSSGAQRIATFMRSLESKGIDTKGLAVRITSRIRFVLPRGGIADGYEATILPDICAIVIEAARTRKLLKRQDHVAKQCAILQHGFATVGIIALVDEATGYQEVRARDALAKILEKFIAKELRKWVSTFPPEFYQELYRLKGWDYSNMKPNSPKPIEVGKLTDDLVYKRLAPGVRDELRRVTPRNEKGYLVHKLYQRLTGDIGHPKLQEHLAVVVALMQTANSWETFYRNLNRLRGRYDKTLELPLND